MIPFRSFFNFLAILCFFFFAKPGDATRYCYFPLASRRKSLQLALFFNFRSLWDAYCLVSSLPLTLSCSASPHLSNNPSVLLRIFFRLETRRVFLSDRYLLSFGCPPWRGCRRVLNFLFSPALFERRVSPSSIADLSTVSQLPFRAT